MRDIPTTVVYYSTPLISGGVERGVEAFLNLDEARAFAREILKDPGSSVEILETSKEKIFGAALVRFAHSDRGAN